MGKVNLRFHRKKMLSIIFTNHKSWSDEMCKAKKNKVTNIKIFNKIVKKFNL